MLPAMKRVLFGAALAAVCMATGAQAQVASDNEAKVLERLPADTCQKERIKSAANGGVGIIKDKDGPARDRAVRRWRAEVTAKYGQRYGEWENALLSRVECFGTGFALSRKCEISGFPCARKVSEAELSTLGIAGVETTEIKEMQRLINALLKKAPAKFGKIRKPKPLKDDGGFGSSSVQALEYLADTGVVEGIEDFAPTKANLEALRKAANGG